MTNLRNSNQTSIVDEFVFKFVLRYIIITGWSVEYCPMSNENERMEKSQVYLF